jgi:pimeloyl-ACP methyl ester carboxylesterase
MYRVEPVSFPSGDAQLAGPLLLPGDGRAPARVHVLIGPVSFVKEQSPIQYATRLAKAGDAALIFDPTGFGASEGTPRLLDDPARKVADLKAAIDLVGRRRETQDAEVSVVGICMGCNWAAQVAAEDPRVERVALVVGAYSIRSRRIATAGGPEAFERQAAAYRAVLEAYERDGTLEHHTMVAERMEDSYFSWPVPFHWYRMWTDPGPLEYKGRWRNALTTTSDHAHYTYDVEAHVRRLTVPTLMVNSTNSATPLPDVEGLFARVPAATKELVVTGDEIQVRFYDDPVTIDRAVDAILAFADTGGTAAPRSTAVPGHPPRST